ncbi:MAG: anthranilate phosphoribosyltransferase [Kiritimatiellaceae bacterium]|nr:anthranilate phosphoribosyltransferase [Kiritimatiellaceae bacterium]
MIQQAVQTLIAGKLLSRDEAYAALTDIMSGDATDAQIGAFLTALRFQGETPDVIAGAAKAMREKMTPVKSPSDITIDIVGTGGDGAHTFNISTASAFVIAGAGVTVAKHGSYGVSSQCGSANVLDALGISLAATPEIMEKCLNEVGMAFLFAPALHPAMKHAIGPRKELGVRTLFNILGPICNPASAKYGVIGTFSAELGAELAEALSQLNMKHLFVVHGDDGLDEITTTTTTQVWEVKDGTTNHFTLNPEDLGIPLAKTENLVGGEPAENADIIRALFAGKKGSKRDILLLNSAAALITAGKAADFKEGLAVAAESIDSGAALKKLNQLASLTSQ